MTTLNKGITLQQLKPTLPLFLALIAAGLAGNYFKFPIFLNVDFLFGSIFAMLALQFFGLGRGILAAAIIAGYTYFLWNHPYAIIIMTAEVAVVGWLMGRRKMGMVIADTIYWLIIGMPLVYLFYHVVMHVTFSNASIIMTKQVVNGIANALVARMIFTGYLLRTQTSTISYREIVYNLLTFFVLCPTLIMLAIGSRTDFNKTDLHIRTTLIQGSRRVTDSVETWVMNRKSAIVSLAEMAASRSPQQMQPYLELTKSSDINFPRIGLLDKTATTTAYVPLTDEFGVSNIGISAADRPYVSLLKHSLKPMLSEVLMGRVGAPKPRVFMLAPVIIHGEFGGYVVGVLSLEQIREQLDKNLAENNTLYTLLDKNGNIIMTNRTDQTVMTPFVRGKGTFNRLDKGISQWVPRLPPNTPPTERWQKSFYTAETTIGNTAEWKLILEQPVAPFQKTIYDNYTGKLTLLFLILLGALALAELLSRRSIVTLEKLRLITHDLPVRLATDSNEIVWPESGVKEANQVINDFREMANSLSEQFTTIRQINESLEQRVEDRTVVLITRLFYSDLADRIDRKMMGNSRY
ncbi:MAG: cache domain-containing protein [Syntrophus sp. (in: bacteria)]